MTFPSMCSRLTLVERGMGLLSPIAGAGAGADAGAEAGRLGGVDGFGVVFGVVDVILGVLSGKIRRRGFGVGVIDSPIVLAVRSIVSFIA